ncbi:hypothetical protein TNCV_3738641 [Trichonephila clavipes]|nr:hypothetical protein TNCV_3738641 [Trichonephila clavipes]
MFQLHLCTEIAFNENIYKYPQNSPQSGMREDLLAKHLIHQNESYRTVLNILVNDPNYSKKKHAISRLYIDIIKEEKSVMCRRISTQRNIEQNERKGNNDIIPR